MRENHPVVQRKIDMGAMLHITADGAGRGIPYAGHARFRVPGSDHDEAHILQMPYWNIGAKIKQPFVYDSPLPRL